VTLSHSQGRRAPTGQAPAAEGLTREILALAAVVVLGSIMTILDATIVNVALPTLGRDLHASISTIQWVPTVYLLAFASVIPLTGWISGRFGAKPVWLASLGLFMGGSLLAGLSPSIGVLIGARVVQGLGGGIIMPLGQSMLAQVAGPKRMGRVMSIIGVPMLLAPVFGPLIGGALIGAASWPWIFFVSLPVGLLAIALAVRLLPSGGRRSAQRLDVPGAVLLSGGLTLFLYGLAEVGQHALRATSAALGPMAAGATAMGLFTWRALRVPSPLIDLRLFRQRGFAAGTAVNFVLGTALFGVALLLPLYFELVRGRSPMQTGLLLAPQGLGATITPAMAAAYQGVPPALMGHATSAISVAQRVAGALGTALLAVVLQQATTARLPGFHGGIGQAGLLAAASPRAAAALAEAFGVSFAVALAISVLALIPTALLPRREA
jgi:EmrB/QacA subfamily drug resistance transporter